MVALVQAAADARLEANAKATRVPPAEHTRQIATARG